MPENSDKVSGKGKTDKPMSEKIIQLSQLQRENIIQSMISNAVKPLEMEIKTLKTEVRKIEKLAKENKELKQELTQLQKNQEIISGKHDDLTEDYAKVLMVNKQCKQDLKQLSKRTDDIQQKSSEEELKLDEIEQYERRQNLELAGVPFKENEDVTQVVLDLASKLHVDLEEDDISIAHRLPLKRHSGNRKLNRHPAIIVRCISRCKRNELYDNRNKARTIENFPVDDMENLYINENVTQRRQRLFWLAKQKAKKFNYRYIWSNNGHIYVRKEKELKNS